MAQERGAISMQAFLLSTMGEIALAQGDLATAERHFSEGLAIAERLNVPERIAGLGANLGLIAQRRGNTAAAIQRLRLSAVSGVAGGECRRSGYGVAARHATYAAPPIRTTDVRVAVWRNHVVRDSHAT